MTAANTTVLALLGKQVSFEYSKHIMDIHLIHNMLQKNLSKLLANPYTHTHTHTHTHTPIPIHHEILPFATMWMAILWLVKCQRETNTYM